MKTKITISIVIEQEGQPPRTFASTTPDCLTLAKPAQVFDATCKVAETVLGNVHRRYCPAPGEDADVQNGDANTPPPSNA